MLKVDNDIEGDEPVIKALDTLDSVLSVLRDKRLLLGAPPDGDMPAMPRSLSDLDNNALGAIFSELLAYYGFVSSEMARAMALKTQTKNKYNYVKARLRKEHPKEDIDFYPQMVDATVDHQKAEQLCIMVESLYKIVSKNMAAVSRNIELRRLDMDGSRREVAIGHIRRKPLLEDDDEDEDIKWQARE